MGLQIQYSLIERTPERELLPLARALDLAVIPWGPLAGGVLTGKYNFDAAPQEAENARYRVNEFGAGYLNERSYRIADAVGNWRRSVCGRNRACWYWSKKEPEDEKSW